MMKIVEKIKDAIMDELDGAKEYAEKYIEKKSYGDSMNASKFHEMAEDELKHARYMYEMGASRMAAIKKVHDLSAEDEELWSHIVKRYNECTTFVKMMISS